MSELVSYSKSGNIGIITVSNPPVNALSVGVRQGLIDGVVAAEKDDVEAVVLICDGRTFIAGADISEFGKPPMDPSLQVAIEGMEACSKPIIAAIHGTALGGGLEVALACHYRCAVPTAQLGLPEVKLGLLPGAGGTQRLPRVVGVETALQMITSGDFVPAPKAAELGLVDRIIEGDLKDGAIAYAKELVKQNAPLVKISDRNEKIQNVDPAIFDKYRKELSQTRRGFIAPQNCVDAVEAATTSASFKAGLERERELFMELLTSDQSAAQRHVFFAEREASKINDVPKDTPVKPIKKAAVLGAGTMGGGIAMNFANAGIPVVVLDTAQEQLDRGLGIVEKNYARTVSKGRLSQDAMDKRMGLITSSLNWDALKDVDYVIEAVFEEMDIKKDVFKKLNDLCKKDAILATNTSTLDVDEIAAVTNRPEQVVGTHFFSPANVMKLVEVVRGKKTSHEVLATTMALCKQMKKVPVVVGVCDGFVGNRMLYPYTTQAQFLVEEGALPQQVDKVLYDFGFAMGPFAVNDLAGLDVGYRIRKRKGIPTDRRYSAIGDQLAEMGRYGQKTNKGWYKYAPGDRTPQPDPEVEALIKKESEKKGIERREISDQEILDRCLFAMINEGAKILEEGIAQRAGDIDIIYIYGYGFPVHRGGPMFYADTVGLKRVYDRVCEFREQGGVEWEPAPLLKRLAEEGKTFN